MRTLTLEPDTFGTPLAFGYVLGSARDWARLGNLLLQDGRWNGEAPPPTLPANVVAATSKRYLEAYRRITGAGLKADSVR